MSHSNRLPRPFPARPDRLVSLPRLHERRRRIVPPRCGTQDGHGRVRDQLGLLDRRCRVRVVEGKGAGERDGAGSCFPSGRIDVRPIEARTSVVSGSSNVSADNPDPHLASSTPSSSTSLFSPYRTVPHTRSFAKRAIFQATASMLLPSLTIHSIVKYTALFIKKQGIQNIRVRQWLPSALGYVFSLPLRPLAPSDQSRLPDPLPNSPAP